MKLLVRLAAVLGGTALYTFAAIKLFPGEDANIGAGLIYFGLLIVVAGLWGLWDGSHATTLPRVFVRWAVVAVVVGLAFPIRIWSTEGRDFDVLWSDLSMLTPFVAGLVLAPAAVGIALGHVLGAKPRTRTPSAPPHLSL
ncbi:hypothetical protein FB381_2962 [Nocardioides albertanoniae]|uniref:Uncharacterized protein n=1 Tax=Nocardioides albertanoniae TaxID=1175486 RepID=A0A543A8Y7_9ACTN|nr:hypothetical protein [Nocardioides albertanoniae]TQL69061.1 hypothetical protein FB381_2962 [Nocardioides albertanoniae]